MKDLVTQAERARLLPAGSDALFVVLFWSSSDPDSGDFRRQCESFPWPTCFRMVAVDVDSAPEILAWYEPRTVPMLAVVSDAAILSIEHHCSDGALAELARCGRWQYSLMKSMSS